MTDKLKTVHDALNNSVLLSESTAMVQGSYRVDKSLKDKADNICKESGTSLSSYVRSCIEVLVEEYNSAPEVASDESE